MSLAAESGYTKEEVDAVLAVRKALLESGVPREELQEERELVTITLVAKCRVEEAVTKFKTYREDLLAAYGVSDVFSGAAEKALAEQWHRLAVAGVDEEGRRSGWGMKLALCLVLGARVVPSQYWSSGRATARS